MPVACIITLFPEESDELRRQLIAAGYSVQFATPQEEVGDVDLIVSAANVHVDYALQYAAEVASEADADVIVAPGVIPGSEVAVRSASGAPAVESASEPAGERAGSWLAGLGTRWQEFLNQRSVAREQKRLERERRTAAAEERRQNALRVRAEQEARAAAERERTRAQLQEDERRRAAEAERLAAEQELLRAQRQAEENERRRAAEAERARMAAEAQRAVSEPVWAPPTAEVAPAATAVARQQHSVSSRRTRPRSLRQGRAQRALLAASVAALVVMVVFAIVLNTKPTPPLPNGIVNNPVQEQAPFGPARTPMPQPQPTPPPAVHPATRATLPQSDAAATPVTRKPSADKRIRHSRRRADGRVAQDEVIIHHYGTRKHPVRSITRAGIPTYSDQQ